jgi:hypothetical protein
MSMEKRYGKFKDFRTYEAWLKLPPEENRFYSNLLKGKKSDSYKIQGKVEFDEYYRMNPHLYKRHEKWWNSEIAATEEATIMMHKAFEYSFKPFKYEDFPDLIKDTKYNPPHRFSYVERDGDWVTIPIYEHFYGWRLWRIVFWNLKDNSHYAFAEGKFKEIGYMMMPADLVKFVYYTAYDSFYSYFHRSQHPDSINTLKSIDRFKYLPIERFERVNYFRLLNATKETIYSYEILLKFGAIKTASELLISGQALTMEDFKKHKDILMKNRSLRYQTQIKPQIEAAKQRKAMEKLSIEESNKILQQKERLLFEYDDFIIMTPKDFSEFQFESKKLNHCVGWNDRYLKKHVKGISMIFFMRRKEEPDKPFFTIEVDKDQVLQVQTEDHATDEVITDLVKDWFMSNREILINQMQAQ